MRTRKKHPVKFGDVLCNTRTGRYYAVAGATTAINGNRRRFATCIEVSVLHECLHEPPISFDKETVTDLVYVNNIEKQLQGHISSKGLNFNPLGIQGSRFTCAPH